MGQKPPITAESEKLDPRTLEELCLNVGTLATVYLKPIHQVFRAARPRRLQPSPALQRLPVEDGTTNMLEYNPPAASMASASTSNSGLATIITTGIPTSPVNAAPPPNFPVGPNPAAGPGPGMPAPNDAVSAADSYFNGIGSQQMAAMDLGGRGDGGIGGGGAQQTQYVVTQNQQQVYQPQLAGGAATGELLLL